MGYTHYFNQSNPETFARTALDAKTILESTDIPVASWDGTGEPEITEGKISFNGADDDSYESFVIPAEGGRGFCKTAHMPYDAVVTAVLIRLAHHGGSVSSDGNWAEWADGRALVEEVFGETPENCLTT